MPTDKIRLDLGTDFRNKLKTQIKTEVETDINNMGANFSQSLSRMEQQNQDSITSAIDDLNENLIKTIAPIVVDSQSAIVNNGYYLVLNENSTDNGKLFIKYNSRNVYVGNVIDLPNQRLAELERKVDSHMHLIKVVDGLHEDANGNLVMRYSYIAPITNMEAKYEGHNSTLHIAFRTY